VGTRVPAATGSNGDSRSSEAVGDGGAVDPELGGESADRGAALIGSDEVVDVGGGEASLGRV